MKVKAMLMKFVKILAVLVIVAAIVRSGPMANAAVNSGVKTANTETSASGVVKNFYAVLTDVMKQGDKLGFSGREKKLAPAVRNAFNLPLMTRFAVGPVWQQATESEQNQLISAFSDFSVATYASRFAKYEGERFEVLGQKPASGGGVIVETRLTPGGENADPVALNYLLRQDDKGSWRIVDVFLDGAISELATRRSEFTSIVQRDGIPALVNSLGEKSRQMGPS
ncbi:MAG: ABC transporter substrate-binding protein [Bdellovibrionales bacterium]